MLDDTESTVVDGISNLIWYLGGQSASLSRLLPMLQSMGVTVLEERPFTVTRPDGLPVWIYQFKVSPHRGIPVTPPGPERDATAQRFADAVTAIWHGHSEIDRFNELVLRAGLTWQQVAVLRAYAKYLKQAGFSYSQSHIADVLNDNAGTARSLVELFEALFCPTDQEQSEATRRDAQAAAAAVAADIDALVSLDTDRVLRAFASMMQATLRTNYFVTRPDSARARNVLSLKMNPELIDELPLPRPKFEIFVYSPRVEGVHLRFGFVARGGLRWSDRREDFRTEVLGLVKAQAVKNAVIVPVGAKGGFVVKKPPAPTGDPAEDRDATREEGVACYRLFIAGLLDLTDNVDMSTGAIVTPRASSGATVTTPTSWWPRTRAPPPSLTSPTTSPSPTVSGSVTRSPPAVRSATTTRRWVSPPRVPGSRSSDTSARWVSTPRPRSSPSSASVT